MSQKTTIFVTVLGGVAEVNTKVIVGRLYPATSMEGEAGGRDGQSDLMGKKSAKKPLDTADALQIVIDLARQSALDVRRCDPELRDEAQRQQEAIDMVEDLAVNKFGDD